MPISALSAAFQFNPGFALQDGGLLTQLVNDLYAAKSGIVAFAGGGQVNATPLGQTFNEVDTVATAADSVQLPAALVGSTVVVYNATAVALQVFGSSSNPSNGGVGDTIAPNTATAQAATAVGVSQAAVKVAIYICFQPGQWKQFLSA